jgi:hypothetical protein
MARFVQQSEAFAWRLESNNEGLQPLPFAVRRPFKSRALLMVFS